MSEWAEREVKMAAQKEREAEGVKDGEFSYGGGCYESALKAFKSLCEDGHSGMSIMFTKSILNRLIDGKPLQPLTGEDHEWTDVSDYGGTEKMYRNNRMSSVFKYVNPDGSVRYSCVDRYVCIDIHNGSSYTGGGASSVIDKLYPITFPYWPTEKIKLYAEDWLTDEANGDYDTKGYLYLIHPEDGKIEVNRFFKEDGEGFVEIDKEEYEQRKEIAIKVWGGKV